MTFTSKARNHLEQNQAKWPAPRVLPDPSAAKRLLVDLTGGGHLSFKYRGAQLGVEDILAKAPPNTEPTVVAVSSGNFGAAVAQACRERCLKAVIFVPQAAPDWKQQRIVSRGAQIIVGGKTYSEAFGMANDWVAQSPKSRHLLSSTAEVILQGAATHILQLIEGNRLGKGGRHALILPCGVGSLPVSAARLTSEQSLNVDLFVAEAQEYAKVSAFHTQREAPRGARTLADGVAVLKLSEVAKAWLRPDNSHAAPISEADIARGMAHLWQTHGIRAEGAGALSTAFALRHSAMLAAYDTVWCLITGRAITAEHFDAAVASVAQTKPTHRRPTVIISTGRSGSTALDRALNLHPRLCMISELFEPVGSNPLLEQTGVISGEAFYDLLDRPTMEGRRRVWKEAPTKEVLALPTGKPWSLWRCYTLPALAADGAETLDREVRTWLSQREPASPVTHLRALFNYLTERSGAERWVERTGGSAYQASLLIDAFPDARFVHLHRRGPDVARSMFRHPVFHAILRAHLGCDVPLTLSDFGRFWSDGVVLASDALAQLPQAKVMTVAYEDLCGPQSATHLAQLAAFLRHQTAPDTDDLAWAAEAARTFRPLPPRPAEAASRSLALDAACGPGTQRLLYRPDFAHTADAALHPSTR